MDSSYPVFGMGLLSIHLFTRIFLGPLKTMNSMQFHAFCVYKDLIGADKIEKIMKQLWPIKRNAGFVCIMNPY